MEDNVQILLHLIKRALGLLEEAVDNAAAELPVIVLVVHIQYLLEGGGVD